jgi:hypothetical protein
MTRDALSDSLPVFHLIGIIVMIPPVPPNVLVANPKFEKLHQHLIKDVLDTDASTRSTNATHKTVSEQLRAHRARIAEDRILTTSLFNLCTSEDLPRDLRNLIVVIASYISDASQLTSLTADEHDLMKDDADSFLARINEIATLLEKDLKAKHDTLTSVVNAANDLPPTSTIQHSGTTSTLSTSKQDPLNLPSQISDLASTITNLLTHVLPSAQIDTTNTLISLLKSQASYMQHIIRHLEQVKHGAEARHLVSRAMFLATVAQGIEAKSKLAYLEEWRDVYSPDLRELLKRRMGEIEAEGGRVEERRRVLQAALREYEAVAGGAGVMRSLGKRLGEVEGEIEGVKRDVERLELEQGKGRGRGVRDER